MANKIDTNDTHEEIETLKMHVQELMYSVGKLEGQMEILVKAQASKERKFRNITTMEMNKRTY